MSKVSGHGQAYDASQVDGAAQLDHAPVKSTAKLDIAPLVDSEPSNLVEAKQLIGDAPASGQHALADKAPFLHTALRLLNLHGKAAAACLFGLSAFCMDDRPPGGYRPEQSYGQRGQSTAISRPLD